MKKRLSIVLALMVILTGMVWAGGQQDAGEAELDSYTIKAGFLHGMEHQNYLGFEKMKEILEAETDGRIKLELYPAGQLGTDPEMLDQVKMGTLHFTIGGKVSQICPELNAFALPFLLKDLDHVEAVLKSDIGKEYAALADKNGYHIVAYVHNGFRQFTNNSHPIKTPEDLEGLKMRVPPMDIMLKTMEAMGATCTPIPFAELYMALKTNVVDGEENPYPQIYDEKFYEVQKYMTVVNYLYPVNTYVTNPAWWNGLPDADRDIIEKAAIAGADYANKVHKDNEANLLAKLQDLMEVYIPTDAEMDQFKAMVQPVYDWAIEEGYITQEKIDEIKAMAN